VSTLTDSNASLTDRVIAGASLASELLPVSVGDVKDVYKLAKKVTGKIDDAKDTKKVVKGARTEPKDLQEQLTLEEAKGGAGEPIMQGRLKDPKYNSKTGTHDKMGHNHDHGDGTSTEVHYDRNRKTGEGSGYKIKDDTNRNSRGNKSN
jgi:hypothetical protein